VSAFAVAAGARMYGKCAAPGAPGEQPTSLPGFVGKPCPYCGFAMTTTGKRRPTRDHVRPRANGAGLGDGNRLIVCRRCNQDKRARTIGEFLAALEAAGDPRARHVALARAARNRFEPVEDEAATDGAATGEDAA
jgi:hypothetical protein